MRVAALLILTCTMISLTACESWESIVDSYRVHPPTVYTARIDAAKAVSSEARKNELLAKIVVDAATHSNELEDVRYGIRSITDNDVKELATVDAAEVLFRRAHYEAARRVAMMIHSSDRRDAILEKLSEGGPPPA